MLTKYLRKSNDHKKYTEITLHLTTMNVDGCKDILTSIHSPRQITSCHSQDCELSVTTKKTSYLFITKIAIISHVLLISYT